MKKTTIVALLLTAISLASCSTSKQSVLTERNLKDKVRSVKTSVTDLLPTEADTLNVHTSIHKALNCLNNKYYPDYSFVQADFDKHGNILKESFFVNDTTLSSQTINTWHKGLLTNSVIKKSDGSCLNTDFKRNDRGLLASWIDYDQNGNIKNICVNIIKDGKIVKRSYWYDKQYKYTLEYKYVEDKLVQEDFYGCNVDDNDDFNWHYLYTYDNGKPVSVNVKEWVFNYEKLRTDFEYKKFMEVFNREMGKLNNDSEEQESVVNTQNYKVVSKDKDQTDKDIQYDYEIKYSYNSNGDVTRLCSNDMMFNIQYEYDSHNNWTKMTVTHNDNPVIIQEREILYY